MDGLRLLNVVSYCMKKRFSLMLKDALLKSYVRSAILYGSETWCLKER